MGTSTQNKQRGVKALVRRIRGPRAALDQGRRWVRLSMAAALTGATAVVPLAASSSTPVSALGGISCSGDDVAMTTYQGVSLFNRTTERLTPIISSSQAPVAGTIVIDDFYQANQVGLVDQGNVLVFTAKIGASPNGVPSVITVDLTTGASVSAPILDPKVAGAINLQDGIFYYGGHYVDPTRPAGSGLLTKLSTYDPVSNKVIDEQELNIWLPGAPGGNGDLMFDKSGNMYIVSSGGPEGRWSIYRVDTPIPTNRPVTIVAKQFATGVTGDVVNGLAFGTDGYVYASGTVIRRLSVSGELITEFKDTPGTNTGTDMASCVDPPRVRLYKNLPDGRIKPADQFNLEISGANIDPGNNAVTSGSEIGLQEEKNPTTGVNEYVGPILARGGDVINLTESAAAGTNLADYSTSFECNDVSKTPPLAITVTGTGANRQITMPQPDYGVPSADIVCVYTNAAAPVLTIQKRLPNGRLNSTDQFTMSVTPGSAKATTTGTGNGLQPEKAVVDPAVFGTAYTFTETASGSTNLDYYTTTWSCVDAANNNADLGSGTGTTGTITLKLVSAVPNAVCTFENIPKTPVLDVTKSVDPASGTAVVADQELTYTVTYTNKGGAPAAIDLVDDLTGVIDDATVTVQPSVTSGASLLVSGVISGKFTMKGELAPGATSTVTYKVKVKPDGQRGDNLLENFVLEPGKPTPEDCLTSNKLCTVNPVPELVMKKDVDPLDGSTVLPGTVLTYTMTFDNTKGESPAPVDMVDNLAGVLDDAKVVEDPKLATGSGLTVSAITGSEFTIKGQVPAGAVATVTYKVQVLPDADRGDSLLENFLLPPGKPVPETCPDGDPMCTKNPVPGLSVAKDVIPEDGSTVVVGQELLYTLTFRNSGAAAATVDKVDDLTGILDDATVTEAPKISTGTGLTVSAVTDGRFTIKGQVAPGATVTVTMRVRVLAEEERGDDLLLNFVLAPGEDKPDKCDPGDPLCTENPVARLKVVKDVVPEDGSTVQPGQELTYTLTFENAGEGEAIVDKVDNLAGILDDATVTQAPQLATGTGLTVSPVVDGAFSIQGTLAAGEKATVTMKVIVKPNGERGDSVLLNFVIEPGKEVPEECPDGDPLCTRNPVPGFGKSKSVDPADGTAVVANQELTYTLTFTNTGAAAATVDETDTVTGILDDATVSEAPKLATGAGLTVSAIQDGKFTIKGELAAGATATVTMKVIVNADGQRGDDDLLNFIAEPGVCLSGDPFCTENPVSAPAIDLVKAIDSIDDVDGNGSNTLGDIIRYKFTVTNTGNVTLSDIKLVDPMFSPSLLTCPKQTLEPKEVMVCIGATHVIDAGDVADLVVNNTATVTGTDPTGKNVTDTDNESVPVVSVQPPVSTTTTTTKPITRPPPPTGTGSSRSFAMAAFLSLALGGSLLALSRTRRQTT